MDTAASLDQALAAFEGLPALVDALADFLHTSAAAFVSAAASLASLLGTPSTTAATTPALTSPTGAAAPTSPTAPTGTTVPAAPATAAREQSAPPGAVGADTIPAMLAPGEAVLTKGQADSAAVPEGGRVHASENVQHFAAGTGAAPPPPPGGPPFPIPLPVSVVNFPAPPTPAGAPPPVSPIPLPVVIAAAGVGAAVGAVAGGGGGGGANAGGGNAGGGPFDSFFASLESIAGVLDGVVAGMQRFEDAITNTAGAMAQFVGALAPGALVMLDYAVRTLEATLGAALMPAFEVLVGTIHNVAGVIDPVMHELAPALQQLAEVVSSLLITVVRRLAAEMEFWLPAFQAMLDVVERLLPAFNAMETISGALLKTMGAFLEGFLGSDKWKGTMDRLKHALEMVAGQLILFSARIATLFGDAAGKGGFIDTLRKSIGDQLKPPGHGEAPAPTNAHSSSLESIGKDIAAASFLAGGTADDKDKTDNQWLANIADQLKDFKAESLSGLISKGIKDWWDGTTDKHPPPAGVPPAGKQGT